MTQETKNIILATCLSILVVLGWEAFYAGPQLEKERQRQAQMHPKPAPGSQQSAPQTGNSPSATGSSAPAPAAEPVPQITRADALAESPRIKLDAPAIYGSIALKGARLDDVSFKNYRETVDPNSPHIVLLSPADSPAPYYVETGFIADPGSNLVLPGHDTLWQADRETLTESSPVTLTYDNGQGLVFHRKIAIDDRYMFTVTDSIENKSAQPVSIHPFAFVKRHGRGESAGYSVLHEGFVGVIGDSGVQQIKYDKIEKEDRGTKSFSGTGGWLGITDKYWAAAVIPDQNDAVEASFSGVVGSTPDFQSGFVNTEAKTLAPGASSEFTSRVFAGAKETDTLDKYRNNLGIEKFDLLIDWGWFYFITRPLFRLIDLIYRYVGNFGVAILIVTVLVKLAFFPLANRSYQSMAKMKKIQPQIAALKDLYPDDKVKQQQEQMALFKKEGVNPVAGCLPMVIQIPVFFALYKVIFITIEMRHAPFFGWIRDLSSPDPTNVFTLFGLVPWDPTALPAIGHFLHLGIWPLIMGVSMFFQMKMNPEPADPVQKTMFSWMPVIFTFMLGTFPAGLVIYWTWNNTLTVIQQYYIMTKAGVKVELWDNLFKLFARPQPKTPGV